VSGQLRKDVVSRSRLHKDCIRPISSLAYLWCHYAMSKSVLSSDTRKYLQLAKLNILFAGELPVRTDPVRPTLKRSNSTVWLRAANGAHARAAIHVVWHCRNSTYLQ